MLYNTNGILKNNGREYFNGAVYSLCFMDKNITLFPMGIIKIGMINAIINKRLLYILASSFLFENVIHHYS